MTGHETPKNFTWEEKKNKTQNPSKQNKKKTAETESEQYQTLHGVATLKTNFKLRTLIVPIQFRYSSILLSTSYCLSNIYTCQSLYTSHLFPKGEKKKTK